MKITIGNLEVASGEMLDLVVDGVKVTTIGVLAEKTKNFQGVESNLQTQVCIDEFRKVLNTPIEPPKKSTKKPE